MPRIFVDCDGVLADFDSSAQKVLGMPAREFEDTHGPDAFWDAIRAQPRFYYNLDLMPDAIELMMFLGQYEPWILTGSPSTIPEAHFDKQQWVKKHFGPRQAVVTCQSKDKSNFCAPGDILIDDYPKHRAAWERRGGIWIDHFDTYRTIGLLKLCFMKHGEPDRRS